MKCMVCKGSGCKRCKRSIAEKTKKVEKDMKDKQGKSGDKEEEEDGTDGTDESDESDESWGVGEGEGPEFTEIAPGVKAILVAGVPHAVGTPAMIVMDWRGSVVMKGYYFEGVSSRTDGPAVIYDHRRDNRPDEWWVRGERAGPTLRDRVGNLVAGGVQANMDLSRYAFAPAGDGSMCRQVVAETFRKGKRVSVYDKKGELAMVLYLDAKGMLHRNDGYAVEYHGCNSSVPGEWWDHGVDASDNWVTRTKYAQRLADDMVTARDAKAEAEAEADADTGSDSDNDDDDDGPAPLGKKSRVCKNGVR